MRDGRQTAFVFDDRPLDSMAPLVLDCQTTSSGGQGRIIELAWARGEAAQSHLVGLGASEPLPKAVTDITGIDRDMLGREGVELWTAVAALYRDLPPSTPTVIHYASFERPFLERVHQRFYRQQPFPFDIVCTHVIAKHLLPTLPKRTLRALAGY